MKQIPCIVTDIIDRVCHFRLIFFDHFTVHICGLIKQCQLIYSSSVCNCSHIAVQLTDCKVICSLTDRTLYRIFIRYLRFALRNLYSGFFTQSKFFCVFCKCVCAFIAVVFLPVHAKLVSDVIKIIVTGITKCSHNILIAMSTRIYPAFWVRCDFIENSGTIKCRICCHNPFCKSCRCCQHLVRRSRRSTLLRGIVIEWSGQTGNQLIVVFRVHGIGQSVIVIARIRNTCQHLTGIGITDYRGSRTRLQSQLSRSNLQIFNFLTQPGIRIDTSVIQTIVRSLIHRKYPLLIYHGTDLCPTDTL